MKAYRILLLTLVLVLIGCMLGLSGCASEKSNPLSASQDQVQPEKKQAETIYPPLTADDIATLIPGLEILQTSSRTREDVLDDQSSRYIQYRQGGTISHRNCGVEIGPWALRSDQLVTVSTPVPGTSVVDFYPHPYQFNGCIRIWIDLTTIRLPPGRRWDEVEFWYQEADGSLTRYWGEINLHNMTYSAWPDHFSRYILGIRARS